MVRYPGRCVWESGEDAGRDYDGNAWGVQRSRAVIVAH